MTNQNNDLSEGKKAALYCRVSTDEQADFGFSLSAQEERLRSFCFAKGWDVYQTYIDGGQSGRSLRRPAYDQMMNDMDEWDALVVLKMDRIHRNSKNFALMMDLLNDKGKDFISTQESFDTTSAMGRFTMDIVQRIAQLESEQIGERVYTGMKQKASQASGFNGMPEPYGYKLMNGKISIRRKEADTVKHMFWLYGKDYHIRKIMKVFQDYGIKTKKGKKYWDPKTIARILSNPLYCGFHLWDGILYRGSFRPLISPEVFNTIQYKKFMKRKNKKGWLK